MELGSRKRDQAPPPSVVWEALAEPNRDPSRPWLELREDEVIPEIVEAAKPALVVWSSLWPDRPGTRSASIWSRRVPAAPSAGRS
jgi:hypothetical protein